MRRVLAIVQVRKTAVTLGTDLCSPPRMLKPPLDVHLNSISIDASVDYLQRTPMPGILGASKRRRSPHSIGGKRVKPLPLTPSLAVAKGRSDIDGHAASRLMDPGDSHVSGSSQQNAVSQSREQEGERDGGQSTLQLDGGVNGEGESLCQKEVVAADISRNPIFRELQETAVVDTEYSIKARQKLELLHWGQRCQRKRGVMRVKECPGRTETKKLLRKQPSQRRPLESKDGPSPPALGAAASEKGDEFLPRLTDANGASTSGEGEGDVPAPELERSEAWHCQDNAKAGYAPERFLRGKGSGAAAPDVRAVLLTLDRTEMVEDFKAIGTRLLQKPKIRRSKIAARNLQMLGLCLRLGKPSLNSDMLLREYAPRLQKKSRDKRGRGLRAMTDDDEESS